MAIKRKATKCPKGTRKLKSPVREPRTGLIRRCTLKKKSKLGRQRDRKHKSKEFHELRYRKKSRKRR